MTAVPEKLAAALADRYRIEREIGQGGMATVYLAEDVKHKRKVALKVLKPELAAVLGAERFVVEITTTAALQHPHILPLFDSGTADGFLYYVMPFIDGETLRSKLDRETQLGVDEAVRIASDVASALHYAHTHGVIHRDIKPENILLHDGRPMVADFGIALAVSAAAGGRMTETGLSLGTPHYMSPEQATAEKQITARSDVYSLGSVLYEMLTGNPPHVGSSAQQIIMKIVTDTARPVVELRKSVPANVAAAVAKSLEKLPADRFESAKAFGEALSNAGFTAASASKMGVGVPGGAPGVSRRRHRVTVVFAGLTLLAAVWGWGRPLPRADVARFNVVLWRTPVSGADRLLNEVIRNQAAISRDGLSIVFSDSTESGVELWRKRRHDDRGERIRGTDGGSAPFFSPDGAWIGYFTRDGRIRKTPAGGGGSVDVVSDANRFYLVGTWMDDGSVIYVDEAGDIRRVAGTGGQGESARRRRTLDGRSYMSLWPLPGSRGVLVTICPGNCAGGSGVYVLDLRTDSLHLLVDGATGGWYAPTGHLLYTLASGGLYAAPFDARSFALSSGAVSVIEGVVPGDFSLSASGTVLYSTSADAGRPTELAWVERSGAAEPLDPIWLGDFQYPAIAPDGRSLAVSVTLRTTQLWVRRADGSKQQLTLEGTLNWRPSWSPDGRTIAYSALAPDPSGRNLMGAYSVASDGSERPRSLGRMGEGVWEVGYSRDGKWLIVRSDSVVRGNADIWARRLDGDSTTRPVAADKGLQRQPALSPDGRWLAYTSDESGRVDVYVVSFPDGGSKRLVSRDGGTEPRWAGTGRELFFKSRAQLMVVDVPTGATFAPSAPRPLFSVASYRTAENRQQYDVSPDGRRFLMIRIRDRQMVGELFYVENWFEELRAKMAVRR